MQIYIKNIPKELLLYELWLYAKTSFYFKPRKGISIAPPILTISLAKNALNYMIGNNDLLSVCTFYGKLLYVDITGDYLDPFNYNAHNGKFLAEEIILHLKKRLLKECLLKFILK